MAIERKCENCANKDGNWYKFGCCLDDRRCNTFIPKEELVRQEERNKVIAEIIEDFTNPDYDIAITKEDGSTYSVCVKYLCTHTGIKENKIIISN